MNSSLKIWFAQFMALSRLLLVSAGNIEPSEVYKKWPYRIFKMHEHPLMKDSSEVCLFIDCSCQDSLQTRLNINCTSQIGVQKTTMKFPDRIDTENFMDFENQIELFLLKNNDFKQIPNKAFSNLRVSCLEVTGNNMEVIGKDLFSGVKQLNRFLLTNEKNLKTIEKDAFSPIKYLLLELDLSSNDIDNTKLDRFATEISKLHNLQQLSLRDNLLTTVKSTWFQELTNLDVLNLDANFLKRIDPSAFQELTNLKRISLADNLFTGLFNQTPFESVKNSLVRIDVSHNEITHLPTFGYLEKLRYFDFSHNAIQQIEDSTFTLLFNLYSLDLTSNNISSIEQNAFSTLSSLFYLRLGDNRLEEVPNVKTLTSLVALDLNNQNGRLIDLADFQFERKGTPYVPMEVNIEDNNIENFEKRVFCSNNYNDTQLDLLTMSFQTFTSIIDLNHCILTQLKAEPSDFRRAWTKLNIADVEKRNISQLFNEKNYCNCDLRVFFENIKVNLTGIPFEDCPLMVDYWRNDTSAYCFNHTYIDTCSHQVNYQCHYVPVTIPTRPTTTTIDYGIYYENSGVRLDTSWLMFFGILAVIISGI